MMIATRFGLTSKNSTLGFWGGEGGRGMFSYISSWLVTTFVAEFKIPSIPTS